MLLTLITMDLCPGDVVISRGNYRDKTVAEVETLSEKDTLVTWTCGGCTRYNPLTTHTVLRGQ